MLYKGNIASIPKINQFYTVRRNTVWHMTDRYNILIFIIEGRCRFTSFNETVDVKEGDAYFIPAGIPYLREPINNEMCTMTYFHFLLDKPFVECDISEFSEYINTTVTDFNNQLYSENKENNSFLYDIFINSKTSLKDFSNITKQLHSISLFSPHRSSTCYLQSSLSLGNILLILYKNLINSTSLSNVISEHNEVNSKIKKALTYISQHYTEPISLEQLSTHCSLSKQQIIRYFKICLGKTPTSYILQFKIVKAKELLFNQETLSIKEISYHLGFEDQHYFSRIFKKQTGETPSQYRYRVHHYSPSV